ncbi:hypothetical protein [Ktedonospora formicarum]|uniref:Uncharacterized protein n=1 Tax=Ktedonospora formicarum TaxID=2778364 RepID=A0A8J3HRM0_9CHLR|nr:hypothetical protein [Ktedonospora formicarum]GHO42602.1 hypothetical protein KSX_07650 [Ktedonospora formicarum]
MTQQLPEQERSYRSIQRQIPLLTKREKVEILLKMTRTLENKEKGEILGATGFQFLKHQVPDLVLKILVERYVKGFLWSVVYVVAVVACLFFLILLNAQASAFATTIAALIGFFVGFLLFGLLDFFGTLRTYLTRKLKKVERSRFIETLDGLEYRQRVALLKEMGQEVFKRELGDSVIGSFVRGIVLSLVGGILTGLFLLLSVILANSFTMPYLPYVAAIVAFLVGYLLPHLVQNWLGKLFRGRKRKELAT